MHKEKFSNHMEDYLCVGVFIMSMIMQKLTLKYTNNALYPLLSKTYNRNKFKNSRRKGLIFYCKTNGITSLKKHVDAKHTVITKMFKEEINFLLKRREERQLTKKKVTVSNESIFKFFSIKDSFRKEDVPQKNN
jgi:hypothetical protein